jgi:two-component system, chemotaxis family, protein-glutamate methylesterase/glutaminase
MMTSPLARTEPITVVIVDDSSIVRRVLRRIFESDPAFRIIGEATTGREAVQAAVNLKPRLMTIDVVMPEMDGLEAIEHIMAEAPTRLLVITADSRPDGRDLSFEALSRGALELIPKPTAWPELTGAGEILALAKRIAPVPVVPHVRANQRQRKLTRTARGGSPTVVCTQAREVVAIGASTGGPRTLQAIFAALPPSFGAPIVVVQHLADAFAEGFVRWLAAYCSLRVHEVTATTALEPRTIYVALRGGHAVLTPAGTVELSYEPPRGAHRPSVDVLFETAARAYGSRGIGVLLSGMGADGAQGLRAMADAGALTIAQDESSCAVFGMPKAAIELGAAQHVLPRDEIPRVLVQTIQGGQINAAAAETSR